MRDFMTKHKIYGGKDMEQKRSTGRAIIAVVVSFVVWELIGLLIILLTFITIAGYISNADSLQSSGIFIIVIFGVVLCAIVYGEYKLCSYFLSKISKNTPTATLAFKIFGWLLIVLTSINILSSISDGSRARFLGIYVGYCFIRKAKKLLNPIQPEDKNDGAIPVTESKKEIEPSKSDENNHSGMPFSTEYYNRISAATYLATATMGIVQSIKQTKTSNYLFCSDVTTIDTIFFSCFILRMLCVMSTHNRAAAEEFSDLYVSDVQKMTADTFPHAYSISDMFNNRTGYYDEILSRKSDSSDWIPALLEQFDHIIQTDLIEKKYVPFSSYSPMPLIGFDDAFKCRAEVNSFFHALLEGTKEETKRVMDSIQ